MQDSEPKPRRSPGRVQRLFRWTKGMLASHGHHLIPLAATIVTLSSTWIILGPVLNRSGDNIYHIATEYALLHGIKVGDNPLGPIGMDFGQPILRFYQALFYLQNTFLSMWTNLDLRFLHNLTIVVCFGFSPFSYAYFLRKLGLNKWTAGLGGLFTMTSVAAFGNSFEAYHQAGIVTQSMGGLFFPWFMGNFIGLLRGENRATSTGLLFALAFLSHAIMSIFAVFAGALYFLVSDVGLKRNVKRLAIFGLVGASLVAFWALPFIQHTNEKRAIPDSITRGAGVHWFTSVSRSELSMVLSSGRLLDDPPRKGDARNADDHFMDKISIIGTLKTRPRALTALTAFGVLVALFGLRRTSRRFLVAGLAFSLMLFAGPDDFRWLFYLPFMKHIQTFRCTYLVEFFAFGLAALGVGRVLSLLFTWATTRRRLKFKIPLVALWSLAGIAAVFFPCTEIWGLGQTHLRVRPTGNLDRMVDACSALPDRGYPYRISPHYEGRSKIRHGWLSKYGYHPYCTHWKGVGPTAMFNLCMTIGGPKQNPSMYALAGVRYFTGSGDKGKSLQESHDKVGYPKFDQIRNGKDRRNKGYASHVLLDTGFDSFLRPLTGPPTPVVCNDKQWIRIAKSWTTRYRNRLWNEKTPVTMRVSGGGLASSGLLGGAPALLYLDHTSLAQDREALSSYVKAGGKILSPVPIDGLDVVVTADRTVWDLLPEEMKPVHGTSNKEQRQELDPGANISEISMIDPVGPTYQRFDFDIAALEPLVHILPMQKVVGWNVYLDGEKIEHFAAGPDFVGVLVPEGAHRLSFHWTMPTSHKLFTALSFGALLWVLGAWALAIRRRLKGRYGT